MGVDRLRGARSYARPIAASGDRILATVLFTDIVDSTLTLQRVGDAAWRDLLAQQNELLQFELDRYRGREVKNTGDGIVALFDGPARAVECAASMVRRAREAGLEIRAGLHTGEVELVPDDVRGMAVHQAARIMALAAPGEVLSRASRPEGDRGRARGLRAPGLGARTLEPALGAERADEDQDHSAVQSDQVIRGGRQAHVEDVGPRWRH